MSGLGTAGWGESDVEEIVEALETLYRDREAARTMGALSGHGHREWIVV